MRVPVFFFCETLMAVTSFFAPRRFAHVVQNHMHSVVERLTCHVGFREYKVARVRCQGRARPARQSALAPSTARINGVRLVFWCPFGWLVDVDVGIHLQVSQRRSIQATVHNTLGGVRKLEKRRPVLLLKEYSQQGIRAKIVISSGDTSMLLRFTCCRI